MATQIQFRRGTAVQHGSFTGADAEVTVNTTNKSVHVHDGSTAGGFELARADLSNTTGLSLTGLTTVSSLKISNDLYVSGVSTFVGAVTFQGGTITLGDANTDNVVFTADVNSNIVPNIDNSYDLGSSSQQWRNLYVNGTSDLTDVYVSGVCTVTALRSTWSQVGLGITFFSGIGTNLNISGVGTITTLDSTSSRFTWSQVGLGVTFFSGIGTNLNISGVATVTTLNVGSNIKANAGILTATTFSGNLEKTLTLNTSGTGLSGSSSFNNSGDATFTVTSNATNANTASTIVSRDSSGNFIAGVVTATTFSGALQGNASTATALQTARTFEITGDVLGSAVTFDGTGNVSIAATIQPNSVGLGTDTTGPYVESISGTSNQITVTGGTGEGSTPTLSIPNQFTTPQDATISRDLQVNRNLNVNGSITIGGTSATLFTTELKVYDPDLVLGFRTDTNNNDVSTDNTANHGGIAIASTEGTPLVNLFIAGIETTPATYKKIMWFKAGTFSGLGTDAWLSNYAIGIGSTQVPNGARLAVGRVIINNDDISNIRNINASGIVTTSTLNSTTATITTLGSTWVQVGLGVTFFSGIGTNLNITGISTLGVATCTSLFASGIVTATDFNSTSDIALKENIRPIQNSTEIINGLEGVRFVWKADGKESLGVIAQEVEKTLPELVSNGDIKTVNYNGLIGVLIEAIKDQQKQIDNLRTEIENLKEK